jgi:nickel-dependent lactate racemase
MVWISESRDLSKEDVIHLSISSAEEALKRICGSPKRVLLLPPDITRAHCGAGYITEALYLFFRDFADVHVIPTLGQHVPHTPEQHKFMFGSIPEERIHKHDWRGGCRVIGEISADFVRKVSEGKADWPIPVSVSKPLLDIKWDLIINIGHVVPHEVLGFANHNKNYFIGLGGKEMICASHMMAACCGIENNLGRTVTPLRECFNKAEAEFLSHLPDVYIQLVMNYDKSGGLRHTGFYCGNERDTYFAAANASAEQNISLMDKPLKKVVAFMRGDEFHSTWVANKAVYRTRMAIADGGELLIIAPGLKRFGEQPEVDALIRKHGYTGTEKIMRLYKTDPELQDLAHAAAHLIHGSTEGRFKVAYAPGFLTEEEINGVGFDYADLNISLHRYNPDKLKQGPNMLPDGEEIYFIKTPAAGLWASREKFHPPSP